MASLGTTTYTSVAWTSGDIITEAKLDAMVANDQAYDSHSAEGLQLDNNKALAGKNAAGTAQDLIKIDSSDKIKLGTAGYDIEPNGTIVVDDNALHMHPKAKAYSTDDSQVIGNSSATKVIMTQEVYDVGSDYDTTNSRFVAPVTGYYLATGQTYWLSPSGEQHWIALYVNGAAVAKQFFGGITSSSTSSTVTDVIYLTAAQYVELYVYQASGGNENIDKGDVTNTFLTVHLLSV